MKNDGKQVLLDVKNLKKYFNVGNKKILKAVDDISLQIYKGETLGLVGESGCGKSTFGRTVIHLYDPTDGTVTFDGTKEGIDAHGLAANKKERDAKVIELLETVGLQAEHADRFPHEFSGGQRQRVGIARALAVNPDFIVCDEPISALDVSIQAQVINLLEQLQRERGLTYLFIAHDLSMVKHISDRIGVMYLGSLVELADSEELFENPMHPYTKALLSAIPIPDPDIEKNRQRIMLEGTLPNPIDLGEECKFCSRCPVCKDSCHKSQPKLVEVKPGHFVACSQVQ